MAVSLGPHGTLVMGMKQSLLLWDAFREPASPLSRRYETHLFPRASAFSLLKETLALNQHLLYLDERARSWGPPIRTSNRLLHCPLHCGHFCNGLFEWSPLLTDQCLWRALINACYRYGGHPYSSMPGCQQHPGTRQDLAATRGCIREPARIWQPPQQGDIKSTFSHHRYRQSKITFIDKLGSHQVSSYSH
jgi:hypothetical protein